jgi:hypothetical protein
VNQRISENFREYQKAWRQLKSFYASVSDRKAKTKWYSYLFCCLLAVSTSAESDLININVNLALPAKPKFIITENKRQQSSD